MSARVVDASVLVAMVADSGPVGSWAETLVAEGDLVCPHLAPVEAANILRRFERSGAIDPKSAGAAHEDLLALSMILFPSEPFASRIWQLRHNVTAYDAWYVAIAESLRLPLATLDECLARSSGPECEFELPPAQAL